MQHFINSAKAYVALLGAIVTALLAEVPPDTSVWRILTYAAVVTTAIVTWSVPNGGNSPPIEPGDYLPGDGTPVLPGDPEGGA